MRAVIAGAALSSFLIASQASVAVSPDDFQIKTTSDLVKLCAAEPADPNYTAAIHFCQGFGSGVFQTEQMHQAVSRVAPLYCVPAPMPTRDQAIAGFLKWAKDTPAASGEAPAVGVIHYLISTYPCPAKRR